MSAFPHDSAHLLDLRFLEVQARAGALPEVLDAFARLLATLDDDDVRKPTLTLLARAIRVDLSFLTRRPAALFQCLHNRGFWCAAPEAALFFKPVPGARLDAPLQPLLREWLSHSPSPHPWLRSLRPPPQLLEGPLREEYRGDFLPIAVGFDDDDFAVWIDLLDGPERVYRTNRWSRRTGLSIATSPLDRPRKDALFTDVAGIERDSGVPTLVHQPRAGATLRELHDAEGTEFTHIVHSPDGRLIAVTGTGEDEAYDFFNLYEAATGNLIRERRNIPVFEGLLWSADSRLLAATTSSHVSIFDSETGALVSDFSTAVKHIAFSQDRRSLATAADSVVHVWSLDPPLLAPGLASPPSSPRSVSLHERRTRIVDGACLCDAESGALIARIDLDTSGYLEGGPPEGALFLGENRIVSFACGFEAWDTKTGRPLQGEHSHNYAQWHTIAFSVDGLRYAVTRERDEAESAVAVRDVDSGALLTRLAAPRATCLAFSPDGSAIATGDSDHGVHLWNAVTGQLMTTFSGHAAPLTAVAFSCDGRCLVSAGDDEGLSLWDTASGELLATRPLDDSDPGALGYLLGVMKYRRRFEATVAALRRIDGWAGFTADVKQGPFVARRGGGEIAIVRRETGEAVAWLPGSEAVHAHPSGTIWAGSGLHFRLEPPGAAAGAVAGKSG
jgi:WD40 repeat protein